ncbi:GcrA family cell cycle regulator [Hansschlegelia sp.]|uniref:GcrA family cell cycle regulator n=1 Tax=Hansschlegelia sp. TaxID=2041892 RepID=UPI002B53B6BE|nr:GcrA family cell cycle regulator [Hansschlegelia sp.]HVI27502.1 GcrA family cell cycle regulator [Hansschlegelia sp.]
MRVPDERREIILNAWAAGSSASEIADALGGTTRSAVIGIVHRAREAGDPRAERLQRAAKPKRDSAGRKFGGAAASALVKRAIWKRKAAQAEATAAPAPAVAEIAAPALEEPAPVPTDTAVLFLDARGCHCRFPLWGGPVPPIAQAMVCGAPSVGVGSWCAAHLEVVSAKPTGSLSNRAMRSAAARAA